MQEAEKYRDYAADCRRLAEKAANRDRQVLMNIAEAWEQQALLAEARQQRSMPSQDTTLSKKSPADHDGA